VIKIIQNGKVPPVENATRPAAPLYMPPWKNVLTDEDIRRIADYLWSLQKKKDAW
jgi:mono/diheme cytochrome c family protein